MKLIRGIDSRNTEGFVRLVEGCFLASITQTPSRNAKIFFAAKLATARMTGT